MTEKREKEEIDFGSIKGFFSNIFAKEKGEKEEGEKEPKSEIKNLWSFIVKYQPVFLILIPLFLCFFLRMYSASLSVTDSWAQSVVYNQYKSNIESQVSQQYPDLLEQNKQTIINNQFNEFLSSNKAQVESDIKQVSQQFKSQFKYMGEDGKEHLYLSDIDTYLWYGEAKNYLKYGHFGTEVVNGTEMNMLRNGRHGLIVPNEKVHMFAEVYLYKIAHLFNKNIPLMSVIFVFSAVIIGLSIIPAFFIGKRLAGNVGGFFAALIVAINPSLLARTIGGVADTDPWNIFFPLMIMWAFLEAFEAKKLKNQIIFASLSGLLVCLYSFAWGGWWYIFDFIVATGIGCTLYFAIIKFIKKEEKSVIRKDILIVTAVFIVVTCASIIIFRGGGASVIQAIFLGPTNVVSMKDVGISTIWPNVLTTVAEFNAIPLSEIISQTGGNILFFIGLMGIIFLLYDRKKPNITNKVYLLCSAIYYFILIFFNDLREHLNNPLIFIALLIIPIITGLIKIIYKKEYKDIDIKEAILITIWFTATAYGFTKGSRFGILLIPAFAIAFGTAIGTAHDYLKNKISEGIKWNKVIVGILIVLLFSLLLLSSYKQAESISKSNVIMMNDAWYDALIEIKNNSTDAIITSWWDFGHWFVSLAERRVTFDGADQGMRIYWVGNTLITSDEERAINVLRMLNCGQDNAYNKLYSYLKNDLMAVNLVNEVIAMSKEQARKTLKENGLTNEQAEDILKSTHCDNFLQQFYIASEDMVGKAGVWGHFGSWDFNRAKMYTSVKGKAEAEGMKILKENFSLSQNEAFTTYYDIQQQPGDQWITNWPSYMSGEISCTETNESVICGGFQIGNLVIESFEFDKTAEEAFFNTNAGKKYPQFFVYPIEKNGQKDVYKIEYIKDILPLAADLIPKGDSFSYIITDPKLADSMFTRLFYYEGRGLEHFVPFSYRQAFNGEKIYVYTVRF